LINCPDPVMLAPRSMTLLRKGIRRRLARRLLPIPQFSRLAATAVPKPFAR
jgi:hypothetical protein